MRICSHVNNFFRLTMGALFGKQKKPPSRVTDQDKAILVSTSCNVLQTKTLRGHATMYVDDYFMNHGTFAHYSN